MGAFWDRHQAEVTLVRLCDSYDTQIRAAYGSYHSGESERAGLHQCLQWALHAEMVSSVEHEIWRHALQMRTIILCNDFRIVLEDIRADIRALRPIVEALPDRIKNLGDRGDDSNVVYLR